MNILKDLAFALLNIIRDPKLLKSGMAVNNVLYLKFLIQMYIIHCILSTNAITIIKKKPTYFLLSL